MVQVQKATERYLSFRTLLSLLVFVAIINYFSPCDGRGSNLLAIYYQRMKGTYIANRFEVIPFDYSFSNLTVVPGSKLAISFVSTHPAKVVCFTGERDLDVTTVSVNETSENRFYVHSDRKTDLIIPIHTRIGEDSRVFCIVTDVGIESKPSTYYASAPFVVRFTSLKLKYGPRDEESVHFDLTPKGLHTVLKTEEDAIESGRVQVVCTEMPLLSSEEGKYSFSLVDYLPLSFNIDEKKEIDYRLQCAVNSFTNASSWSPLLAKPLSVVVAPISAESPIVT